MKKDEITRVRLLSLAVLMALSLFILLVLVGNNEFGQIISKMNNNALNIPESQNSVYNLYYYTGFNVVSICSFTTPSRYTESIIACMDTDDSHILANNSSILVNKFNIADTNAAIPVLPILKRIPATDIAVKRIVSEKNN